MAKVRCANEHPSGAKAQVILWAFTARLKSCPFKTRLIPQAASCIEGSMQNSVKVLIVEDEPNALMGLAELISGWGYRTETARDGIEGWEKALAWEPAIVVTDLKMPRLDGIGLLERLSAEGSGINANVAVVMLTAMGSIQLAVDAMKMGAYDFLQKPVDATRLRTILANATR